MAKFPTIEELTEQVIERVLEEILIDGEPLGKLIDSGELVHIVRCKDCAYYRPYSDGRYDCDNMLGMADVDEDGFCSRAERKEE